MRFGALHPRQLLGIVSFLALAGPAAAAPVVITFDDLAHRAAVLSQYSSRGVTFNRATCLDYSLDSTLPAGFAHSGSKGIEHCYSQEFCSVPIEMTFTAPQRRVKAWVGYSSRNEISLTVTLKVFNAQNAIVGQETVNFPPRATPRPINTSIEAVATTRDIVRATLEVSSAFPQTFSNSFAVDDVEYDTEGPPPECLAALAPTLSLLQPTTGTVTQIGSYILQGSFTTTTPLTAARLTVTGPGGASYSSDLLSWSFFPLTGGTFGPIRVSPLFPGTNQITVTVENCRGPKQLTRSVTYNPIAAGSRFVLDSIEVTQTIQDMNNFVTLIAGKRTVARVYLRTKSPPGGSIANVTGTLIAFRPDGSRPGGPSTVRSLNSITVGPDTAIGPRRSAVNGTLNFELPPEWTSEGRVHLQLTSISIEGVPTSILCDNCGNRSQFGNPKLVEFEDAPPVRVVLFSVPYRYNGVTYTPRATDFDHLESWLRRAYPTSRVLSSRSVLSSFNGKPGDDFDCDDVNWRLHQLRTICFGWFSSFCFDTVGKQIHYYGMVADDIAFMRGCARGIPSRVASGPSGSGTWGWDNDGSYADWYGGHELAHTYDRRHPGYCGGNSDDDDDFPYANGSIGAGHFGFDVGDSALGIAMAAYSPSNWTDVMTYCDRQWISDYTYEGILGYVRDIEGSGGGGGAVLPQAILIQGEINLTRNAVTLRPFLRLSRLTETARPKTSPFAIELRGSGGRTLARHLFDPVEDTEAQAGEELFASFDEVLPWVDGTQRIVILKDGRDLASRVVSANAPQVRLTAPNSGAVIGRNGLLKVQWEGSDADGDALTYMLLYSTDNGKTWEPVDTGLTGLELDVPLADLRGGDLAKFRIVATDGVNTSEDDQDVPMKIAQKAPEARILSPASGAKVAGGQVLLLEGEGSDLEDGHLDDAAFEWSADGNRILGRGPSISVDDLLPGRHRLTLTVRDSSGAVGQASVDIEVIAVAAVATILVESPVSVQTTVELDGTASTGNGAITYAWKLLVRPRQSAAQIVNPKAPVATLRVDLPGTYTVELAVADETGLGAVTRVDINAVTGVFFVRGEATGDNRVDISDAVRILGWLFLGEFAPACIDAADANDDGRADLSDSVHILAYLFLGGAPPARPFPQCGVDPTADKLDCQRGVCP